MRREVDRPVLLYTADSFGFWRRDYIHTTLDGTFQHGMAFLGVIIDYLARNASVLVFFGYI